MCVEATGLELTNNEFDELWINTYERFDCCTKKQRKDAKKNCSFKPSIKKGAYDLDSPILDTIKEFLMNVSSS